MKKIIFFLAFVGLTCFPSFASVRQISISTTHGSQHPQAPGITISAYYDDDEDVITFSMIPYSGVVYVMVTDSSSNDVAAAMYYVTSLTEYEFDTSGLSSGTYTITFTLENAGEYEGTFTI